MYISLGIILLLLVAFVLLSALAEMAHEALLKKSPDEMARHLAAEFEHARQVYSPPGPGCGLCAPGALICSGHVLPSGEVIPSPKPLVRIYPTVTLVSL